MKVLGIWGSARMGPNDGFGYAGLKLVETFKRHGIQCAWEDEDAPIAFNFCQPQLYGGSKDQYRIGYTPWESTRLPDWWIPKMLDMDEIWTTSKWCRDVFEINGLTDVQYFPHGLDPNDWSLEKRDKTKPFIFFHMGEPADRKNGQLTFDAFKFAFGSHNKIRFYKGNVEDIYLLFKTNSWLECRWKNSEGEIIGPVTDYPNVDRIEGLLDIKQLNELYMKMNVMIYPSSGEGFGLIPLQSIGTGMPTLLPAYSGMKEFSSYGIEIPFVEKVSEHGYHEGSWAFPSVTDLSEKMIDVYVNYDEYAEEAYENAKALRKEFVWDEIIEKMLLRLQPHW